MYNGFEEIDDWYSDFDDFDESLNDIDFSDIAGKKKDFKSSFKNANKKIDQKKIAKKTPKTLSAQRNPVQRNPIRKRPIEQRKPLPGKQTQRRPIEQRKPLQQRPIEQRKPIGKRPIEQRKPIEQRPIEQRKPLPGKVVAPITKKEVVEKTKQQGLPKRKVEKPKQPVSKQQIPVTKRANIDRSEKKISRILVPDDKKVIVEGVSKFILSQKPGDVSIKNIGYYKGQKLKELVLIFNNTTPNPFTIELFNPSAPLDYLYNTSQNLNNKIEVSGNQVAYSDVLFNLLANPTLIPNCKFTFAGVNINAQKAIPLSVIDREITGEEFIQPLNIDLTIDNMQVQGDVTFFDISQKLNRPYIPDGMDTIQYTVLPNMSVIMAFFYYQKSIKKAFFEEARIENQMKLK